MGRAPCCDKVGLKRGPWQPEEDEKLIAYIQKHGHENWRALPQKAGLLRCGKSCRLRWTNYLRPDIKRGGFTIEEDHMIIQLHSILGNRWSVIAAHMPGRTDNEIKNYWNTHLRKQLLQMGVDPVTHRLKNQAQGSTSGSVFNQMALWETARFQAESRLAREYLNFISRKQPMTSRNNDQVFAEWLEEYFKSFGKYLDVNDAGVQQPSATDVNQAWTSENALVLEPFSSQQQPQQQFSDSSFGSECSTLPQLSEQDGSFAPLDITEDDYPGGAARQDSILHATILEDLRSPSVPPALAEFGSTEDEEGSKNINGSSSSNIPPLDLSCIDDQQFTQASQDLDLLELTTTESIASNSEYWSTILRIVGT